MSTSEKHFDGEKFFNPSGVVRNSKTKLLRWLLTERKPWPKWVNHPKRFLPPKPVNPSEVEVTFVNHVTFLIRTSSWSLITDPHFGLRASPFQFVGPKRVCRPGIELAEIPEIDYTLISHNHYDHMDLWSLKKISVQHKSKIILPLKNGSYLERKDIPYYRELDWWESVNEPEIKIHLVPAEHWSSRSFNDTNEMLWGGFVIEYKGWKLFFAGDTGYGDFFKKIRAHFGEMNLSLLPIGAYEPRWFMKGYHMNPEDAVKAHLDLGSQLSVGMHFGTFQLTNEGIDEPKDDLKAAIQKYRILPEKFLVPEFGETFYFRV